MNKGIAAENVASAVRLPIDDLADKIKLRPQFSKDAAKAIVRRALEVAIHNANLAEWSNPPREEWEARWRSVPDRAGMAAKKLQEFCEALAPPDTRTVASEFDRLLGQNLRLAIG